MAERRAVFDLFFWRIPHDGATRWSRARRTRYGSSSIHSEPDELEYLSELGLFHLSLVDRLADSRSTGDVYALPEGTPASLYESLLRLEGTS
ncbi:hypothetical protein HS125_13905 [bacterium]|nr:hypothetical protein [bacterium]